MPAEILYLTEPSLQACGLGCSGMRNPLILEKGRLRHRDKVACPRHPHLLLLLLLPSQAVRVPGAEDSSEQEAVPLGTLELATVH